MKPEEALKKPTWTFDHPDKNSMRRNPRVKKTNLNPEWHPKEALNQTYMKHYRNPEWNPKESLNDNLILLCIPNETLKTLGASQRNLKALKKSW